MVGRLLVCEDIFLSYAVTNLYHNGGMILKEIYNRKEAAELAGVSQRTILRAIQARKLDAVKLGEGKTCTYMISHLAISEYIQKRGGSNAKR